MAEQKAGGKPQRSYNFGEKKEEFVDGSNIPVWQSPKYIESKEAAISLLESKDFGNVLTEGDFWILMNKTKSGKMAYTGLIISHDALLKINNVLPEDKRFNQKFCGNPESFEYAGKKGMIMVYRDERDGMLEVGEITQENCKNGYPYAMLFKRTFDRVVKRKAGLIGIYSDSEADEFKDNLVTVTETTVSKKETKAMTQTIPVPEEKSKNEESPEKITFSLSDALAHSLENGNAWKGKTVKEIICSTHGEGTKKKILEMYKKNGSDNDQNAASVVLKAIEAGKISFQSNVEVAS